MSRGSFVLACVLLVACNKAGGDGATGQGKERGACYGNGTCDDGLQCMSEVCVRPPPADCAPVAEKLASYRLGNYAPRDERAKVVGELTAQCQAAKLTVDEGACIVKAQSRYDVAKCPRPLLEELVADGDGCQVAAATVTRVLLQELGQGGDPALVEALRPKLEAALADSCVSDLWPEEAKRCITGATSSRDLSRCEKVFPRDLGDRIGQRIKPLLEELTRAMMSPPTAPPPPPPPPPPQTPEAPPGASTGASLFEQACQSYAQAIARYAACPGVPAETKQALQDAMTQMRAGFDQMGASSPETVQQVKSACDQAEKALGQAMATMGC